MIHHVSVGSNDIGTARVFYDPVLEVVGMGPVVATQVDENGTPKAVPAR